MQIVIEIKEKDYQKIQQDYSDVYFSTPEGRAFTAIVNGTVLPKHGRLIDADEMTKDYDTFKESIVINRTENGSIVGMVCVAPTILEATEGD